MSEFIKLENVTFRYNEAATEENILKNINLSISKGEFVTIMGANGSGKSTLLKHLNALLTPSGGCVFVDGIDTKNEKKIAKIRSKVGIVLQNPDNQIVSSVVEDDVAFGPENLGIAPSEIRARVEAALTMVDLLKFRAANTNSLSGGQKQRLAIAGVLAMNPDCILLDEPTSMLDPAGQKEILKILQKLNKENKITIVLVSHSVNEAAISDRVIILEKGSVASDLPPKDLLGSPATMKKFGLEPPETTSLMLGLANKGLGVNTSFFFVGGGGGEDMRLFKTEKWRKFLGVLKLRPKKPSPELYFTAKPG